MSGIGRREFLLSSLAAAASAQSGPRPPNFVVILADDLGYGDLACYGSRTNETPNLDRMAHEGVRFTDAYAPMPYCAPVRASLLTGRYPFRHGMWSNPAPDSGIHIGLSQSEVLLPQVLKPRGYKSCCIGKWHLGHTPEYLPRKRGFDEYYGILYSNDMRPVQIVRNEEVAQYPVVQGNLTRDYTGRALDFLDRNRANPFLLYLPHAMPHKPLAASEEFYRKGTSQQLYSSVIRELDWSVGRVLQRVKDLGLDDNTLVMFLSDNGPWYGGSTGPFRGMKSREWEGGIRVPLIARWPSRIPAGLESKEICSVVDVFPTVCRLAGAAVPKDRVIDGADIFPLMSRAGAASPHDAVYAMSGPRLHMIRSGKWKLHVRAPGETKAQNPDAPYVDPRGPDGLTLIAPYEQAHPSQYPGLTSGDAPHAMMLFDVESDPGEQHDVSAQNPEVVARLKAMFDKMDAQVPSFPPVKPAWQGVKNVKGGDLRYEVQ